MGELGNTSPAFMLLFLIILVVQLGQGNHIDEMEPVIEIEMDQGNSSHQDSRREAIKYGAEHYKEIEEKMKGHKKGLQGGTRITVDLHTYEAVWSGEQVLVRFVTIQEER